jgi:ADP-ribosyl-[dinitrogen reductase] hydrolase
MRQPPHENSYHVPGLPVVAGEYPFHKDPGDGAVKLTRLLDAGITCFIDLTRPEDGLRPYQDVLDAQARERGVALRRVHLGVRDMGVPTREEMTRILDAVDDALGAGEKPYVHCWGGIGRTGTVIGCYLVRHGMEGEAALRTVGRLFRTMSPAKVASHPEGAPQTNAQCRFVREWREQRPRRAMDLRDRVRGSLIGLAVGDALGTTVEFRKPGSFPPVTDMIGGGPFGLEPGQWTDDTSIALCLAESLTERRGFDPADQMRRYVRWWREGHLSSTGECFDIGTTTRTALAHFQRTGEAYAGRTARHVAANGSLMRLAPVPLYFRDSPDVIERCGDSSRTTHGSPIPVDACRYYGALIVGALRGASRTELLAPFYTPEPEFWRTYPLDVDVEPIAAGSFLHKQPPAIRGSGYVVDALEAALWAFYSSPDFRTGALLAVNLGDDADTTAAIYGQLAGAYYGESGIPAVWREKLALRDTIDQLAESLYARPGWLGT